MQVEFNCSCGARMRTAAANQGKKAKCPKCGALVPIPVSPASTDSTAKPSSPSGTSRSATAPTTNSPGPAQKPASTSTPLSPGRSVPAANQPAVSKPVVAKPAAPKPAVAKPIAAAPVVAKPVVAKPVMASPVAMPPASDPNFGFDPLGNDFSAGGGFQNYGAGNAPGGHAYGNYSYTNTGYGGSKKSGVNGKALGIAFGAVGGVLALAALGYGIFAFVSSRSSNSTGTTLAGQSTNPAGTTSSASTSSTTATATTTSSPASKSMYFQSDAEASPITEAEANEIGEKFATAVRQLDRMELSRHFQLELTLDDIARDVMLAPKDRSSFLAGFRRSFSLFDQIRQVVVGDNGEYAFLRSNRRDGQLRPIIRLSSENTGVNYHELVLARDRQGKVVIRDIYVLLSGETLGDAARRVLLMMVAERDSTLIGRLTGSSRNMAEFGKAIDKISKLAKTQPKLAYEEIKKLPPKVQQEKLIMISKLMTAGEIGDNAFLETFEEYRRLFPNDPSLDLLSIDYYIIRQQKDKAIETIERLKNYVGGDPFLDKMIAGVKIL